MNIRRKIIGVVTAGLFLLTSLFIWRAISLTQITRVDDLQKSTLAETSVMSRLVEDRSKNLTEQLLSLITLSKGKEGRIEANPTFLRSEFLALAMLKMSDQTWGPEWSELRPGVTSSWPANFITKLIEKLPTARVSNQEIVWQRILDPSGQPLFAVMAAVGDDENESNSRIALGIVSAATMASFAQTVKAQDLEFALIDDKGFALSYSDQQYVGTSLEQHPVVQEVLAVRELSGTGKYKNLEGKKVVGSYEKVSGTNLYTMVLRPQPPLGTMLWSLLISAFGFAIAALILIFALVTPVLDTFRRSLTYLRDAIVHLSQGQPLGFPDVSLDILTPLHSHITRLQQGKFGSSEENKDVGKYEAYQQLGSGLSLAMKGPLAAILGHAQLARSKAESDDLKQHFVVIEREARKARETIENLIRIVGQSAPDKKRVDLRDVVLAALGTVKAEMYSAGIKITKEMNSGGPILGHATQLQTVIEEILRNSTEAMDGRDKKEVRIYSEEDENHLRLIVEDTGHGIQMDLLPKIFDPFFTTKQVRERQGLGLTVVKGIIRNFDGHIRVESEPEVGTKVILEFPLPGRVGAASKQLKIKEVQPNVNKNQVVTETPKPVQSLTEQISEAKKEITLSGLDVETPADLPIVPIVPEERESGTKTLSDMAPITGTMSDQLPSTPSDDEITFVGEEKSVPNLFPANETDPTASSPLGKSGELYLDDSDIVSIGDENTDSGLIRRPKVRNKT